MSSKKKDTDDSLIYKYLIISKNQKASPSIDSHIA